MGCEAAEEEEAGMLSGAAGDELFDMSDRQVADIVAARQPEPWAEPQGTKEYRETRYYCGEGGRSGSPLAELFWADVAKHAVAAEPRGLLLTPNFVFAASSVLEVASAAALIDLPLTPTEHSLVTGEGLSASFIAQSPCIFVAKETVGAPPPAEGAARDLQVTVRVYRAREDETVSQDPRAMGEFLVSEPYCLQVILTNVSPRQLDCQLMVQVPQGAIPLGSAAHTRASPRRLRAFECCRVVVPFYFPRPGDFLGAPVCCSVDDEVVATSGSVQYHVVQTPSHADVRTFADVVEAGEEAVLAFLCERSVLAGEMGFSFAQLYPLLGSEPFYRAVVGALRSRGIFERTVWGYGFKHGDLEACRELLAADQRLHRRLGADFECPLVSVSAAQAGLEHLDYHPLLNKRVHRLGEAGGAPPILNQQLKETYVKFVRALARKPALTSTDRLRLSYYLLCQDRVEEARALFEASGGAGGGPGTGEQVQREYMAGYFDLFDGSGGLATARRVAREQASCPHLAWRERFAELARVIAEVDGVAPDAGAEASATATAPALSAELLPGGVLEIQAEGVQEVVARLYKINLEMLFSRTPFMRDVQPDFSFVKPVHEAVVPGSAHSWQVPEEYRKTDLTVELSAGALKTFKMYFASSLRVTVAEQHGYLKVAGEDGRPMPAAYVKVFAKQGGREHFFKDGYTDLRGRFDYASLSGESGSEVDRFAILVVAGGTGGLVREAGPPGKVGGRRSK